MKSKQKDILICGKLLVVAFIYTILVKIFDVQAIGPRKSLVGFYTINLVVFKFIGVHMEWYTITEWLAFVPLIIAFIYVIIGLIQSIKRKNILCKNKSNR